MSALFPVSATAIATLRGGYMSSPLLAGTTYQDSYLTTLMQSAEAEAERRLRTTFGTLEVLPEDASDADIAALNGARYVVETSYDWEADEFNNNRWAMTQLRNTPVRSIASVRLCYPSPLATTFTVPISWVRIDKKRGELRLVPGAISGVTNLSGYILGAIGSGRDIPHMLRVRYTAGLDVTQYPDLADLVLRMTVLRLFNNTLPGSSQSISADGLSQSMSMDIKMLQGDIDDRMAMLDAAIHGVRMTAL